MKDTKNPRDNAALTSIIRQASEQQQRASLYTADALVDLIAAMTSGQSDEDNALTIDNLITAARSIQSRRRNNVASVTTSKPDEQRAFDQAVYAQGLWWTAARNLELALGVDIDDLSEEDLSNTTLEALKAKVNQ